MSKRILITIIDGLHYRYLVDTGIIGELTQQAEIHVITTNSLKKKLEEDLNYKTKFSISELQPVALNIIRAFYLFLVNNKNNKLSETLNIKNDQLRISSRWMYMARKICRRFSGTNLYSLLLGLTAKSFASQQYRRLINSFRPDLIVSSTPGQKLNDLTILYESQRAGVMTISPVYSWDNLTAKGPFIFPVNKLIVWNNIMKKEAQEYHNYSPESILVGGVPVFDRYAELQKKCETERREFFRCIGLEYLHPLITITTIPRVYFGTCHIKLAKKIIGFVRQNRIKPCNILVRPHPLDTTDYSSLQSYHGVAVDYYGGKKDTNSLSTWIPRSDNIEHLARTMKYSDIVINIASTITIDAACFDTPVINIAYDFSDCINEYHGSISRYYGYTHYRQVVSTGAAYMAYNDDNLINAINHFLQNPDYLKSERKALVKQQAGELDGQSYKRIADIILSVIS